MDKFWNIKAEGDKPSSIDVYIDDFIGDWIAGMLGFGITAKEFVTALNAAPDSVKTARVHINSPGGDVMAATQIANTFRDLKARKGWYVEMLIEGVAASAATLITSAGDVVKIADNGVFFTHMPSSPKYGNAKEHRETADKLDTMRDAIVATYRWKSPLSADALIQLMEDSALLSADEAIANGFADEKIEGLRAAAFIDATMLSKMAPIPDKYRALIEPFIKPTAEGPAPAAGAPPTTPSPPSGGNPSMSADDVRAAAAEINELCKKNDVAALAGDFLAQGKTPEQVRERLKDAGPIRSACVAAKLPDRAQRYIKAGFSLEEVRSDLFEILQARDIDIDNRLPIKDRTLTQRVVINSDEIYAARRKSATRSPR